MSWLDIYWIVLPVCTVVVILPIVAYTAIKLYRDKIDMGNLVISNNPDDEFISLELKKNPNELLKHRFIFLWVKRK